MEENTNINSHIRNFLDGIYTKEEAEKTLHLIKKDPENEDLGKIIHEAWEETAHTPLPDSLQEKLRYEKEAYRIIASSRQINKPGKPRPHLRRLYITAASAAATILLLFSVYWFTGWFGTNDGIYAAISTSYGDKKTLELPDGTMVYLNACTKITYPEQFEDDERRVELEGQAYFQVKRNEKKPFIVKTHAFDVKILGTEFDIKAYKGDEIISVNVESGKVQVDMLDAMVRLGAKEQIEINTLTEDYSKFRDDADVAVWRSGSLRFNRTPIRDVAKELERTYSYRIDFKEGQEFSNLITGEHTNKDLIAVLKSIEFTSAIHYEIDTDSRQVLLYK